MILAVGSISQRAIAAIVSAGGSIDFAQGSMIAIVKLPGGVILGGTIRSDPEVQDAFIAFREGREASLRYRRLWDVQHCRLATTDEDMSGLANNFRALVAVDEQ